MDKLKQGLLEHLEETYGSEKYDLEDAAEAMRIYIQEAYIPDVIDLFEK